MKYCSILSFLFISVASLHVAAIGETLRINGGSIADFVDIYGQTWKADTMYWYGVGTIFTVCNSLAGKWINNTNLDSIYCSERWFVKDGGYKIKLTPGVYSVEMMFAEIAFPEPNYRLFNISVQNVPVATNLDLVTKFGYATAGNITTTVTISPDTLDSMLDINLKGTKENPKMNGIVITKTGEVQTNYVSIPYRVNAGYDKFVVDNKKRIWLQDDHYSGGNPVVFYDQCMSTPNALIYCSERIATAGKLQYKIPVAPGKNYSANLHFSEVYFNQTGLRVFNVSVQGKLVATNLDIFSKVGYRSPYELPVKSVFVNISYPYIVVDLTSITENAKISGIEILDYDITQEQPKLSAPVRINSGSDTDWKDPASNVIWYADKYFTAGAKYGQPTCMNDIDGTQLGMLSCSERYFPGSAGTVTGAYSIPMKAGKYVVKLLLSEVVFGPGVRMFNIKVQGKQVVTNLDIAAIAGKNNAYVVSRSVTVNETDSGISIEFINVRENAKIDAIEIVAPRLGSLERGNNNNSI